MSVPNTRRKTVDEVLWFEFNFEARKEIADDGESIVDVTSLTSTPSGLTISDQTASGGRVRFKATGGTGGTKYFLTCVVETDDTGSKLEETGVLSVYDDPVPAT